ncbi:hypothetical protein [uncultured Parabacteroides sp.]|jgi:hypothetical protein|uniref:hypothetical protein n=1 Tax=uncultured Parabacteroides sp. TaxID=512312 RepID=UPI0025EBCD59|nr:hypothetical protein [uncultured Parabacteroides sp.]
MKTKDINELYTVLSSVKLTGMTTPAKMVVLENIRTLKHIAELYRSDCDDAIKLLRPEGFDTIEEKANRHNEAVKAKNDKALLPSDELQEVNETYAAYFKEVDERVKELGEVDHEITLKAIPQSEFDKLAEVNDLTAGQLVILYENLI